MRNTTERAEATEVGTVKLIGSDYDTIVSETSHLLDDSMHYRAMSYAVTPYGDGMASLRTMKELCNIGLKKTYQITHHLNFEKKEP